MTRTMVRIGAAGSAWASDRNHPEEAPAHDVIVDGFWIDPKPVTNRQFKRFRRATGPCHPGREAPRPEGLSGRAARNALCRLAGLFAARRDRRYQQLHPLVAVPEGADWRHPYGPGSNIHGLDDHPVVHIAYGDALAYAAWAGKDFAHRGRMGIRARRP